MDYIVEEYLNKLRTANIDGITANFPIGGINDWANGYSATCNGFKDPSEYALDLVNAQTEFIKHIKGAINDLDPHEGLEYLDSVLLELKKLNLIIIRTGTKTHRYYKHQNEQKSEQYKRFEKEFEDLPKYFEVTKRNSFYKQTYRSLIDSVTFIKEVRALIANKRLNASDTKIDKRKILIDLSVEDLATLVHLLINLKIIKANRGIEISRMISNTFATPNSPQISENSFKNKLLSPSPKSIDSVRILAANIVSEAANFFK